MTNGNSTKQARANCLLNSSGLNKHIRPRGCHRRLAVSYAKIGVRYLKMQGINYVTNEEGKRVAVMIDLKKHGDLWEDFYDGLTAKKRKNEPRESFESVKKLLKKNGKLNG